MDVIALQYAGFSISTTLDGHRLTLPDESYGGFLRIALLFMYSADLAGIILLVGAFLTGESAEKMGIVVAGLLLLTSVLWLNQSEPGRVGPGLDLTLRQGVLHTARESVPLEDIQRILLRTDHPTITLTLVTARGHHDVATHFNQDAIRALAVELRDLSGLTRKALHERGEDPHQAAEVPEALQVLTRR